MDEEENDEVLAGKPSDRRTTPRLPVDGVASLFLLKHGSSVPCRVVDLSTGGCLIETQKRFIAGILLRVEVTFKVRGLAFRFNGVTQWTDGRQRVGVRFVDVTSRRKEELVEVLREVEQENAEKAAEQAPKAETGALPQLESTVAPQSVLPLPTPAQSIPGDSSALEAGLGSKCRTTATVPAEGSMGSVVPEVEKALAAQALAKPAKRERRAQSRHEVDTSAVIYLVNVGSRLLGRILDLSEGGCRIRTNERFPVGIYTRVEAEFRLEGLPFRLGGVIQSIHDRDQVGLRFLDVSERKRTQVEQLIEEIEEMRTRQRLAGPQGPAEAAIEA